MYYVLKTSKTYYTCHMFYEKKYAEAFVRQSPGDRKLESRNHPIIDYAYRIVGGDPLDWPVSIIREDYDAIHNR